MASAIDATAITQSNDGQAVEGGDSQPSPDSASTVEPKSTFSFHRLAVGSEHMCAIRSPENRVYCYGANDWGQIGIGTTGGAETTWQPILEDFGDGGASSGPSFVGAVSLTAGPTDTCALRESDLYCWGYGTLAELTPADTHDRRDIVSLATRASLGNVEPGSVYEIASGFSHLCMRAQAGTFCWGDNTSAAVSGQIAESTVPITVVPSLPLARQLALGTEFSLALLQGDSSVTCWGFGGNRQCGNFPTTPCPFNSTKPCALTPTSVDGLPAAKVIAAGDSHACAIGVDAKVRCWGANEFSETGTQGREDCRPVDTDCSVLPTVVASAVDGAEQLALGKLQSCALVKKGVWCWGELQNLGRGNASPLSDPQPAPVLRDDGHPLTNIVEIAAAEFWTCALDESDDVYCWGSLSGTGSTFLNAHLIPWPNERD